MSNWNNTDSAPNANEASLEDLTYEERLNTVAVYMCKWLGTNADHIEKGGNVLIFQRLYHNIHIYDKLIGIIATQQS